MTDVFERLKKEAASEMDLHAIWEDEYKAVLAEEIADETREKARKEAEAEIRRRRAGKTGISR